MIRNTMFNARSVRTSCGHSTNSACVRNAMIHRYANSKIPRSSRACASRRKMAAQGSAKSRRVRTSQQTCQDGRRCCITVKSSSGEMSSRSGGQGSGTGRRRGHQHHPRNEGTRTVTIQHTENQINIHKYEQANVTEETVSWDEGVRADSGKKKIANVVVNLNSNNANDFILQTIPDANSESIKLESALRNKDDEVVIDTSDILPLINAEDEDKTIEGIEFKKSIVKSSKNAVNEKRRHRSRSRPKGPRPAVEGGPGPQEESQDDPETLELARLRCTSERTELVAERENRRKNRCADYPGLAFGRSIFSSDTMMKFSIIKNELHNILNAQLKRVRRGRITCAQVISNILFSHLLFNFNWKSILTRYRLV